jgi:arginine decarboxylase
MNDVEWSLEDARRAYSIEHWNGGFFHINEAGMW